MPKSAIDASTAFHRILIATDFSSASLSAFRTGLEICSAFAASLLVLHVFEPAGSPAPETGGMLLELQAQRERSKQALDDLRHKAQLFGVECETILDSGIACAAILDTIAARQIDLAVLGTNALHGFERLVFGSTAEIVLRKAPCPVLTVGPRVSSTGKPFQSDGPIVFATDFDFVTIHAIRYAACFANLNAAPLHCLHVLPRTIEAGTQSAIVPSIMAEALQQLAAESEVVIEPPICATTFGSEISYAVVDYAREHNVRMVVLGVRRSSLLASHVPEHIAYRIITEASCPVLTMAFDSHAGPQSGDGS
jgi:nucleotide-binding universal stress UspA family protein